MAQTRTQTDGHCDSKTESAQWADSVKIVRNCEFILIKQQFGASNICVLAIDFLKSLEVWEWRSRLYPALGGQNNLSSFWWHQEVKLQIPHWCWLHLYSLGGDCSPPGHLHCNQLHLHCTYLHCKGSAVYHSSTMQCTALNCTVL